MQNPLREENGPDPPASNIRATNKKSGKHRGARGQQATAAVVPPPPPEQQAEQVVPVNGVEYDEEEEPSEVNLISNLILFKFRFKSL